MKSKFVTYALIVVVVVVWGVVAFQLFAKQNQPQPDKTTIKLNEKIEKIIDTLILNYDDPFKVAKQKPIEVVVEEVAVKIVARETVIPQYVGKIKKNGLANILLEFENSQYVLKRGDTLGGFCLMAIYEDSIQLLKNGNIYTLQ